MIMVRCGDCVMILGAVELLACVGCDYGGGVAGDSPCVTLVAK